MLRIKNVGKTYSNNFKALTDINLEVADGEFLAVMGPSGSGKSTLINILGLLDNDYTGDYFLSNENYKHSDDATLSAVRGDEIGFVFQNFKLLNSYTVYENIEIPLIYSKTKTITDRKSVINEVIEQVGLSGKENSLPKELSGGQQQRVAIARAIVNNPDIIIADEPTGALDSKTSLEIMNIFTHLNETFDTTIIMVTHDKEVADFAMRTVYIRDGRLYNDEKSVVRS
ncbi:ABC transporter ATP-binding protein [Companilactobacillus sp.]|jgi:putative ABC transport system ATP-binding protein|uniref:ABC transporter ATP-binding protein n=1 Tax=Companilactobacillus sp. TaxID=2767905 RepID=UPI0025BC9800|nr:ABC transporter ATP-binding protein [Companilactobacillus sp.]MCH4008535.1 ABC transporter ATP-binding protein [Companilactobacillus sp.]MCH4051286.1 ABC transporter ATP-binding protein [Companilactobacillus sp.]MCH4076478.1 ABC transporter ATP-binding protein [Companilactobacillus sp.]MCH4125053.1 ABC transporter ATP-binding protein [Companilactobacillus sp.]MCH4131594.1 ABC transporter ATP-binding protein [Companilactobacillus sp.]